jgi:integrase
MDALERGLNPLGAFMARLIEQLTEAKIRSLKKSGLYADGRGLYLQIRPGARSWIFRFRLKGKTRDKGLGPLADVTLVQARSAAHECRALVAKGVDPIEAMKAKLAGARSAPTFEQAAESYMADKLKRLRSEVHRRQWRYTLETYAYPIIGSVPVADLDTKHVLSVLQPIWDSKCETASRLRGRIERIIARSTVTGDRTGSNPATWRGHLQEALPKRSDIQPINHHPAMDFRDLPTFIADLRGMEGVAARALEFLVLTAARTGEVINAQWCEVDWKALTWTVPAVRAKSGRSHTVPLSTGAAEILRKMQGLGHDAIFLGYKGKSLSQMALLMLLQRRMGRDVTVHGFRSAFRDWAGDEADVPRELAEASLAHVVRDATEAAYRRRTAVEKRRLIMQSWCDYCCPTSQKLAFAVKPTGSLVA